MPRKTASIPTASILTYMAPLFAVSGLVLTAITVAAQAVVWWLIVALRPLRQPIKGLEQKTVQAEERG